MVERAKTILLHDFLTVGEAAAKLGVSPGTLRNWDRIGKMRSVRHPFNGYRLYRQSDLELLLEQVSAAASFLPDAKIG